MVQTFAVDGEEAAKVASIVTGRVPDGTCDLRKFHYTDFEWLAKQSPLFVECVVDAVLHRTVKEIP